MAKLPILDPAKDWDYTSIDRCGEYVHVWHGCTSADAAKIMAHGVDPRLGRIDTDFGRGFYTTTLERQARQWAWDRYYTIPRPPSAVPLFPVTVRFRIERERLASLQTLAFVLAGYDRDDDYWSFVQWCRQATPHPLRNHKCTSSDVPSRNNWYDVVIGPVSAFWRQKSAMQNSDQISFHTLDAASLLNDCIARQGLTGAGQWVKIERI